MWVLQEIEGDGPYLVERGQGHSMQLPSFCNLNIPGTQTLLSTSSTPRMTGYKPADVSSWLVQVLFGHIRRYLQSFFGSHRKSLLPKYLSTFGGIGDERWGSGGCHHNLFIWLWAISGLPVADHLTSAFDIHWWSTSGKYLRQVPGKGYSARAKKIHIHNYLLANT